MEEMEEAVRDALDGDQDEPKERDMVLMSLLNYTISSLVENRPIFPNIADEPVIFRLYFKQWVQDYLDEQEAIRKSRQEVERMMK